LAPDILLTQECKPSASGAVAYNCSLWQEAVRGRWGTGLFATTVRATPIVVHGFAGWVTGGELHRSVRFSRRPIRMFSIHCPAGERGYVHSMHAILDALAPVARHADVVLGGDFNVAAGYREAGGAVRMTRAEQGVLDRITKEFKLIPCWQTTHPGEPLAQTLRWMRQPKTPYHCDGIFVPRTWQKRLRQCEVVTGARWRKLSDHNPVLAVID
jgi:endonuclease/exonuclease/phosphatase family metal-dependent hydrolase